MNSAEPRPARIPAQGVLCIDKPLGWTSRDVVNKVSGILGDRQAGHAGTLDPAASGVLLVAFGEATKAVRWLMDAPKTYEAVIAFGSATLSDDAASPVVRQAALPQPLTPARLQAALDARSGATLQVPPVVSALQKDGVRDYERVRQGEIVVREAREVWLGASEVLEVTETTATVRVTCGAGFYVRALARDLGEDLGSAAHLAALRRTHAGGFDVSQALTIDALLQLPFEARRPHLVPLETLMPRLLPTFAIDRDVARAMVQGKHPQVPEDVALEPDQEVLLILREDSGLVCVATAIPEDEEGPRRLKTVRGFTAAQHLAERTVESAIEPTPAADSAEPEHGSG
jgi:tRNA pseudouridine55 synthase